MINPIKTLLETNRKKSADKGEKIAKPTKKSDRAKTVDQRVMEYVQGKVGASQVSTVFACVNLIARVAASCPARVMRRNRDTNALEVPPSMNVLERLLRQPNTYQSPREFFVQVFLNLRMTGNAFIYVQREAGDPEGEPIALYCLPSYAVRIRPLGVEQVRSPTDWRDAYEYVPSQMDKHSWYGLDSVASNLSFNPESPGVPWNRPLPGRVKGADVISSTQMIHIRDTALDGIFGWSSESLFKELHGWERALQLRAAGHAEKDGSTGGFASIEGANTSTAQSLHDQLTEGSEWIIGDGKISVQRSADSPRDSMLVEQMKFVTSEIGRVYGVPPSLLGDERTTSSARGVEETNRQFIANAIAPLHALVGQAIRQKIIPNWADERNPYEVVWDTAHLVRASTAARTSFSKMMIETGAWSSNELRIAEGIPPLEEELADEHIRGLGGGMTSSDEPVPNDDDAPGEDSEPEDDEGEILAFRRTK